jgi:CO/xanthine dehydrogenase Mo-binding subunit
VVSPFTVVGQSVPRGGGTEKVTGQSAYAVDVTRPGMLWGKALRSPLPHARILSIDTSRARRMAGVHAVITAGDLPAALMGITLRDVPVLARDRVRFVGEKVVAVAAASPDIAEEALSLIEVEYEELPAVFDPLESCKAGAPLLHPDLNDYEGLPAPIPGPSNEFHVFSMTKGEVEQGFAESDMVFEHTFTTQRMHQGYLEPHACLVEIDDSGRAQVWANNRTPHHLKSELAEVTGLPPNRIVVYPCSVGGDYGGKGSFMDVPLCYHLARVSGRPVKMIMSYAEELMAGNPRHPSVVTVKTGVKKDGRMWARRTVVLFNSGAYGGYIPQVKLGGIRYAGGCYRIPHLDLVSRMVYTNNVPCGHMRAPGEAQALFAVESHTDMITREMGWDPYEFRLQNVIREGDVNSFASSSPSPKGYRATKGEETLRRAAEAAHLGDAPDRGKAIGRGMSLAQRAPGGGTTTAIVTMNREGRVSLLTPIWDTGTGTQTVLRQIVAEELAIPVEQVALKELDTDALEDDSGVGAGRVVYLAGRASQAAAKELKARLVSLAADLLEGPEEEILLEGGQARLRGQPERVISLEELAARAIAASGQDLVTRSQISDKEPDVTSFCVQVAEVQVDRETGQLRVRRMVTAHDVATIINPVAHQGQINGAFAMGLGYSLMEEIEAEEGRITALHLGDYKLPNVEDMPDLITVLVDGGPGSQPFDGKGIGQASLAPVAPAIANAIEDAIGVRITDLPITAEKVLRALREQRA